ncbi:hypothetical protein M231_02615 [Tremella mesenterica]|uniref:Uncharacterized protein n=1 Tax=Tremella mesenterica TaxID=5217 RepID=A0A4V1M4F2_TREME|nr:uncharacterized protein TREMEDRAFT_61244 [Tremella mesenterica DSM 1558]EIW70732.1 hypothetical protein TREMEDRAFT_61244 [Tremella mesenterica DSM 1558]RXK40157.1 hypothetical protein M231_02615 [Tremella mesenterica]
MSVTAPIYDKSDPKTPNKLYAFSLPFGPEWEEQKDWYSQAAMMGAGAGMFIKSPIFAWGSLFLGLLAYVQQENFRQAEDAMSSYLILALGLGGVFTVNFPRILMAPDPKVPVTA